MSITVSTLDVFPEYVEVVLATSVRQWRATTAWDRTVAVPNRQAEFVATAADGTVHFLGMWLPQRNITTDQRFDAGSTPANQEFVQRTLWARMDSTNDMDIARQLTDPDHLAVEIARLAVDIQVGDLRTNSEDDPDAFENSVRSAGNALNVWSVILEPTLTLDQLNSALPVTRVIAADMPLDSTDRNEIVEVLADYQLVLDPTVGAKPGTLAFLLDVNPTRDAIPPFAEFTIEEDYIDSATQMITCRYVTEDQSIAELVLGDAGIPLHVEKPANSVNEARLEIELQREKLRTDHRVAGALTAFDPSWAPLTTFNHKGRVWQALRVTHRIPSGDSPQTTEIQLRDVGPAR